MKKFVVVTFVVILAACQQNKIGYVDNVKLMDGYKEKMDIEANFKTKAEALTKKRDSISQAFQMEFQTFQIKAQKMAQKQSRRGIRLNTATRTGYRSTAPARGAADANYGSSRDGFSS